MALRLGLWQLAFCSEQVERTHQGPYSARLFYSFLSLRNDLWVCSFGSEINFWNLHHSGSGKTSMNGLTEKTALPGPGSP